MRIGWLRKQASKQLTDRESNGSHASAVGEDVYVLYIQLPARKMK